MFARFLVPALLLTASCAPKPVPAEVEAPVRAIDPAEEARALDAFFAERWEEQLAHNPVQRTYLGIGDDHGSWGDLSDDEMFARIDRTEKNLADLRARFDPANLPPDAALSYRLFEVDAERQLAGRPWLQHDYPITSIRPAHEWLATFLMTVQPLSRPEHVADWLARLADLDTQIDVVIDKVKAREALGVVPPRFVYRPAIRAAEKLLTGAPFEGPGDSPLRSVFREKLAALELPEEQAAAHLAELDRILLDEVRPAYLRIIDVMADQSTRATEDAGCWKLPDGDAYYRNRLELMTTTAMTPEQIHELGLKETERIHAQMRAIQEKLGVPGSLDDFFRHVQEKPELTLPDSPEGRERYLALARAHVAKMDARLDEVIATRPKAALEVRAVETWREGSSGKAFYQRGTVDGSRPGVFYVNLKDMSMVPTYQLPALVYHEGIPGHHLQLSIAQELDDVPAFRRHMMMTAWSEGWGLYSEWLPAEMGMYDDPYDDFGRLAMELWRAGRLVVDTGLHHKRWTREQAVAWLVENTPNSESDAAIAVERYIVWPGQATAYKIGMLELQRMRRQAEDRLGDRFDARGFHDIVLRNGPLPLDVLQEQVDAWSP
jgi:uncharacterized protein (DUF885 family)